MTGLISSRLGLIASKFSPGQLLTYGFIVRLIALIYGIIHDKYVNHIKYTDIDYLVFSNGSAAISDGRSPYDDDEYRYTPLIALLFLPNVLINTEIGKLVLILADTYCGHLLYRLNIYQGTNRRNSKLYLILWLFNPVNIAISTRGSFEPVLSVVLLTLIHTMNDNRHLLSGLIFGLAIHLKLYPMIFALSFYIFLIERKPYLKTQTKMSYWKTTLLPNSAHLKFYSAALSTFTSLCYLSYRTYGPDYIRQSFLYHLQRIDLQHNFSVCFYLFRLLPQFRAAIGKLALLMQFVGVILLTITHSSLDSNKRIKLRKLTFSLFMTTFMFVSLNKVCTSQYFTWYLIFLPLAMDSINVEEKEAVFMVATWLLAQANWLLFAYLYEYRGFDIIDIVGNSSLLFLACNLWLIHSLNTKFDANSKRHLKVSAKDD